LIYNYILYRQRKFKYKMFLSGSNLNYNGIFIDL